MGEVAGRPAIAEVEDAIRIAKEYVGRVFAEEQASNIGVEETEFVPASGDWRITIGLSLPWNAPRTRAQEVLEQLGAGGSHRRSFKVVTISADGRAMSVKDRRE